ncbi:MAG: hypothetical protein NTW75_04275 [Planctomycetales bacterium]|jgi:hypothetical protein|nr:hypothetical protein [Planctomycetales bacterium]
MSIDRREFLKVGAAFGVASVSTKTAASVGITPEETTAQIARYLAGRGYTKVKPVPLVTGHPFNGGLEYDEDETSLKPVTYVVQTVARANDVSVAHVLGTLPLFTILGVKTGNGANEEDAVGLLMGYLTKEADLDPQRIRLTTTKRASHCFPLFEKYGITKSQIRLRPWAEAFADGNGSGYYNPHGHPRKPASESISLEYVLTGGKEIEIGEIGYHSGMRPRVGGLGIERVTMARNNRAMMWSERLGAFKAAVKADAKRQGRPLPLGYYLILGLARWNSAGEVGANG